jgi:peptidyl-prolyl cis-trans isomerase C
MVAGVMLPGLSYAAEPAPSASPAARRPTFAELFGDDVVARGKGLEVKRSQLEAAYVAYRANLAARGQQVPEDQRTAREAQLLERLIVTQLLALRATDEDRKMGRELGDRFMEDSKKGAASEESFYRQLKALGMSPEQFKKRVDEQSLAEAVISREVKGKIEVTDADVKAFYEKGNDLGVALLQEDLDKLVKDSSSTAADVAKLKERIDLVRKENLSRLDQPERVKVQHVFFAGRDVKSERELTADQLKAKREKAEKVRARALAGEDFAKLITENSEDRGVPETKGIYTFSRNDRFSEEFKSASFSLETGKISDVVATPFGYHVIKLLERTPAQKIEFEKASKELKDFLIQQQMQRAMPEYFAKLRKEAGVEVLDAKYRAEIPKNVDPTKPD